MAEFVDQNMEEMIPELEQTRRVGLLDSHQIKSLVHRRRRMEYKIARRTKRPRDYQTYIRHEVRLLALLKSRRHSLGYQFKRDEIEKSIVRRVQRLHRQLCYRFQSHVSHWLAAAKFLGCARQFEATSKILQRMLQVHRDKPELIALTADWISQTAPEMKFENVKNGKHRTAAIAREAPVAADQARDLVLRGIERFPDKPMLYRELVRIEASLGARLLAALDDTEGEAVSELPNTASDLDIDGIRNGNTVRAVVEVTLEKFVDDREVLVALRDVCAEYGHLSTVTSELEERIDQLPVVMEKVEETVEMVAEVSPADRLEEVFRNGGLPAARKWWKAATSKSSVEGVGAAVKYLQLEKSAERVNMVKIRTAAELALNGFGLAAKSVDLWLEYIRAEEEHGDPLKVADLDWRARKFLGDKFLTEYSMRRLYPHLDNEKK